MFYHDDVLDREEEAPKVQSPLFSQINDILDKCSTRKGGCERCLRLRYCLRIQAGIANIVTASPSIRITSKTVQCYLVKIQKVTSANAVIIFFICGYLINHARAVYRP